MKHFLMLASLAFVLSACSFHTAQNNNTETSNASITRASITGEGVCSIHGANCKLLQHLSKESTDSSEQRHYHCSDPACIYFYGYFDSASAAARHIHYTHGVYAELH